MNGNDMKNDTRSTDCRKRKLHSLLITGIAFAATAALFLIVALCTGSPIFTIAMIISGTVALILFVVLLCKKLHIKNGIIFGAVGLLLEAVTPLLSFSVILLLMMLPVITAVAGLIFGVLGAVESKGKTKAGMIVSVIAIVIPVIAVPVILILFGTGVAVIALM